MENKIEDAAEATVEDAAEATVEEYDINIFSNNIERNLDILKNSVMLMAEASSNLESIGFNKDSYRVLIHAHSLIEQLKEIEDVYNSREKPEVVIEEDKYNALLASIKSMNLEEDSK